MSWSTSSGSGTQDTLRHGRVAGHGGWVGPPRERL